MDSLKCGKYCTITKSVRTGNIKPTFWLGLRTFLNRHFFCKEWLFLMIWAHWITTNNQHGVEFYFDTTSNISKLKRIYAETGCGITNMKSSVSILIKQHLKKNGTTKNCNYNWWFKIFSDNFFFTSNAMSAKINYIPCKIMTNVMLNLSHVDSIIVFWVII